MVIFLEDLVVSSQSSHNKKFSNKAAQKSLRLTPEEPHQYKSNFHYLKIKNLNIQISKKLKSKLDSIHLDENMDLENEANRGDKNDNSVNGKRRRTYDDSFEDEYINESLLEPRVEGDFFDTSRILTNGKEILSRIRNIRFEVSRESDTQPIVKKLKFPKEVKRHNHLITE